MKLSFLKRRIPLYLRAKYQLIATVTFTAFFSLLSLIVIIPFLDTAWFELGASQVFAYTIAFYIISLFFVICSKILLYRISEKYYISYILYFLWCFSEVIFICLLYLVFTILGLRYGIIELNSLDILPLLYRTFLISIVSILIPYIIAGMYFAIIDRDNTIRLINYKNVVSDESSEEVKDKKVTLFDNNGTLKMSLSLSRLLYIQSDDNYVKVWYLNSKNELKRYMLRCRLKTIEKSFEGSSLVRCHRQYIVNLDQVKILRKEKDGYELDLSNDEIPPISVTKTYEDLVLKRFDKIHK